MTTAKDGGKVVSLTHRPPLPPGNTPGPHFCYTLLKSQANSRTSKRKTFLPINVIKPLEFYILIYFELKCKDFLTKASSGRYMALRWGNRRLDATAEWRPWPVQTPDIITVIISMRIRWDTQTACTCEKKIRTRFWDETWRKETTLKHDVDGMTIIKLVLNKQDWRVWSGFIWHNIGTSGELLQTW